MLQVNLYMSTAYYHQSNGLIEVVIICLECYLRCMSGDKPKEWFNWISLAGYRYDTTYHITINNTLYQVVYGQPPPTHITYSYGDG